MIYLTAFIFSFLAILLDATLMQSLSLAGVVPNLIVIVVISFSYLRGHRFGMVLGFFSGLVIDLLFSSIIGLESFLLMGIAYLCAIPERIEFSNSFYFSFLMIGIGDLIYGCLYYILHFLLRGRTDFADYFLLVILPEVMYTIIAGFVVYPLIRFFNNRILKTEFRED